MHSKISSAAQKNLISKSNPSIIACFSHPWGASCKRALFGSSWGIFLDFPDPEKFGSVLFNSCSLAANFHSLTPLGLCIMCLVALLCFASLFLGKKYFWITFLISSICVNFIPPRAEMIQSYSCSASSHSKVLRKAIFLTLDEVPVTATSLSKLVRSCKIYLGGLTQRSPL